VSWERNHREIRRRNAGFQPQGTSHLSHMSPVERSHHRKRVRDGRHAWLMEHGTLDNCPPELHRQTPPPSHVAKAIASNLVRVGRPLPKPPPGPPPRELIMRNTGASSSSWDMGPPPPPAPVAKAMPKGRSPPTHAEAIAASTAKPKGAPPPQQTTWRRQWGGWSDSWWH
jgi:hypothetical protein